jgi:hypothetical protein
MEASVRRISRIGEITGARAYLEVGVAAGKTFNALRFPRKVAVDPKFLFDTDAHAVEGTTFHQMTSDEYFTRHAAGAEFDVIFLDGLHTFQQTFRDFCASIAAAHRGTVWLIDDVFPTDIHSGWPNRMQASAMLRAAGGKLTAWHGDVYKVVLAIADYFPTLSFCTVAEGGNPQTVVWTQPRPGFAPRFRSMEAIERLTHADFLELRDAFNLVPEAEMLAQIEGWRGGA